MPLRWPARGQVTRLARYVATASTTTAPLARRRRLLAVIVRLATLARRPTPAFLATKGQPPGSRCLEAQFKAAGGELLTHPVCAWQTVDGCRPEAAALGIMRTGAQLDTRGRESAVAPHQDQLTCARSASTHTAVTGADCITRTRVEASSAASGYGLRQPVTLCVTGRRGGTCTTRQTLR